MKTRKGFTLIELLVVIAIIAILAAILFPVFLSAKSKAQTIKCLSHGKELGAATMMYMADNGDRFPSSIDAYSEDEYNKTLSYLQSITWTYNWLGVQGTGNASGQCQWKEVQLKKYVKNSDIWICPSAQVGYASRYAQVYGCSWLPRAADNFVNGDRGFNESRPIPWPSDPNHEGGVGLTVGEVAGHDADPKNPGGARYLPPGRKIMWMCYSIGRWGNTAFPKSPEPWNRIKWPSYAHADGSVFVYADGHAAFQRMGMGWAPLKYTTMDIDSHQ